MKELAGYFSCCGVEKLIYYFIDFIDFRNENYEKLSAKELEEWAVYLNSPWSQTDEIYKLEHNELGFSIWKCTYVVTGYEGIIATIVGYGDTEVEALGSCKEEFYMVQCKYNPTNKRI